MDVQRDTFVMLLARTQDHLTEPSPLLKHRQLTRLHGLYRGALSDALREKASNAPRVREVLGVLISEMFIHRECALKWAAQRPALEGHSQFDLPNAESAGILRHEIRVSRREAQRKQ